MRVVLIRHGMTPGNALKRYIGRTDEALSEAGIRQVGQLRARIEAQMPKLLTAPAAVAVSPMKRALQTAGLLFGSEEGRRSFIRVEDFRECDFGTFENRNYLELSGDPDYQRWVDSGATIPFPQGEDPEEFQDRCCRAFLALAREREKAQGDLVIVAHGGTVMSIAGRFALDEDGKGRPYFEWNIDNANAFVFECIGSAKDDYFLRRTGCIGIGAKTGA